MSLTERLSNLDDVVVERLRRTTGRRGSTWSNWAGNQSARPLSIERPTNETQLSELVARAAQHSHAVKAVGAGHSFTAAACTDG
ncbi:MAG: hypothetical protein ACKO84_09535, partial [Actinomycetota bacterium]